MLFKRKEVNVRPQRIASVPVQPDTIRERELVVERTGWSSEAVMLSVIAALVLLGVLLYYLWYVPANDVTQPTVIEHSTTIEAAPAPNPPTIVNPPVVVTPPASSGTPDANSATPPIHIENRVGPPASDGTKSDTNGVRSDSDDGSASDSGSSNDVGADGGNGR